MMRVQAQPGDGITNQVLSRTGPWGPDHIRAGRITRGQLPLTGCAPTGSARKASR